MKLYHDDIGEVVLVDHMGSDARVVEAARVSYAREAGDNPDDHRRLIRYMLKHGHTSPFEHCAITWRFTVPLFVARQHHRHRTWAYNEVSRRYTSENIQFYFPEHFRSQDTSDRKQCSRNDAVNPGLSNLVDASTNVRMFAAEAYHLYDELVGKGIAREQARIVLPQNMYTSYYGTVNLHNAIHFLRLRLDSHAQWEIRRVAEAMLQDLDSLFPITMDEARKTRLKGVLA